MTARNEQQPALVVSIHDVSPFTSAAVRRMLGDLAEWGVARASLLVIPNHHGRGRFLDDAEFCAWLRGAVAAGHEAVVHGYFHRRDRRREDGVFQRLVTECYTAGEGEFHDVDEAEAARRLDRALEEFRQAGLNPGGFIAPAWLLGTDALRAVRRLGFRYTTWIDRVEDLADGRRFRSQSLVYSVRAAWRRVLSLAWNECLLRSLRDRPLIRIGLHPPDWGHPAIRAHARKCIVRALAGREAMTYEGWLGRQPAHTAT
jgi:predicted deacetylase